MRVRTYLCWRRAQPPNAVTMQRRVCNKKKQEDGKKQEKHTPHEAQDEALTLLSRKCGLRGWWRVKCAGRVPEGGMLVFVSCVRSVLRRWWQARCEARGPRYRFRLQDRHLCPLCRNIWPLAVYAKSETTRRGDETRKVPLPNLTEIPDHHPPIPGRGGEIPPPSPARDAQVMQSPRGGAGNAVAKRSGLHWCDGVLGVVCDD